MAEEKQKFCAFLKAAILDEEKASKEYKEMAEKSRELEFCKDHKYTCDAIAFSIKEIAEQEAAHHEMLKTIHEIVECNG